MFEAISVGRRRGLTLVEAALVLGITAVVFGGFAEELSTQAENGRSKAVADRLNEVTMAAQQYIKANQSALITASAGGPLYIPVAKTCATCDSSDAGTLRSVQHNGYLPETFVDNNAYGQSHVLVVKTVASGVPHIEGMVFTVGGSSIPDRQIGRVARFMGVQGGFMMQAPLSGEGNQIVGVAGGWAAAPSEWSASGKVATVGHVMATLTTNDNALTGDYLNRKDTGDPEANTMRTDINMAGNNVDNVASVMNDSNPSSTSNAANILKIGPNIVVPGYITSGGPMTAPKFVDGANPNWYVQPSQTSVLNQLDAVNGQFGCSNPSAELPDQVLTACGNTVLGGDTNVDGRLKSAYLDIDTVVYGSANHSLSGGEGIRLGDLLPHYVAMGSFLATESNPYVTVPTCGAGGTPSINLAIVQDSNGVTPSVDSNVMIAGSNIGIGGPISWQYGTYDVNVESNNNMVGQVRGTPNGASTDRRIGAIRYGGIWQMVVYGTPRYNAETNAIASTSCYYP